MSTTDGHTPDQSLSHGPETPRRKPILVIDTNVLIRSGNMEELLAKYELHTVPSVTKEVKDATARMRLEALLPKLTVAAPDTASLKFVSSFAKNTGDFVSLSGPDMEVISLGYQRVKEKGMIERLKSESLKPIDFIGGKKFDPNDYEEGQDDDEREEEEDMQENSGVKEKEKTDGNEERNIENGQDKVAKESEDGEDDDDEWITVPAKPVPQPKTNKRSNNETQQDDHSKQPTKNAETASLFSEKDPSTTSDQTQDNSLPLLWSEDADFDPESNDGWIGPSNLNKVLQNTQAIEGSLLEEIGVGVMTSDFAMQNMLLQIGIPLLSVNGMIIKQVKSYILECFSCYKICRDTSKVFCPVCGNSTLLRVTCSFNEDGTFALYRKKGYKVNLRGRVYNIPRPKGGQRNQDLILAEDQIDLPGIKSKIMKREKYMKDQFNKADHAYECGFGFDDIKKSNKHFPSYQAGYGRKNPNDNEFWKKRGGRK